jgi:hypothetical protein
VSLATWEPDVRWLVLVDDGADDGTFDRDVPPGLEVVVLPHPLRDRMVAFSDRIAAAVVAGLDWIVRNTDADLVLRLDTDALIIAPFREKLDGALADESIGLIGSYDVDCNGEPRDFSSWVPTMQRRARLIQPRRIAVVGRFARIRRYISEARAAGYVWGEHALGCSFAVPRRILDAIHADGVLDDPGFYVRSGIGDDPLVALFVRRAGYRLAGHVGEGETFGVLWHGLPDTPEGLSFRGYSIIHSVKNDPHFSEPEIRRHFRALREEPRFSPPAAAPRPSA